FPKFSPDGKWIAFTGQYDGNFNVYVMPAEGGQPKQLTFYQGSAHPLNDRMGIHDEVVTWTPDSKRIVFLSRRDATNGWIKRPFTVSIDGGLPEPHFNLYRYDLGSKQIEQLTHFTDFDVMWPSLGPDSIVFENAGYLYTFDLQSKQPNKLAVSVPGERDQSMKHWTSVSKNITDFDISPDGKRAVFSARGDVFTVP